MSRPSIDDFVITTKGLTKAYGSQQVVRSLDLQVPRHSIFAFLGPNGAGKSTTIKLLLGLIKPTTGEATVFGYDIDRDSIEIRRRIGYLAQDPRFFPRLTARETLEFVANFFYSGPKRLVDERIDETLELVGLSDKANRPVAGFSGGERQRLGIAQAQLNYPELLILDEPAASLDPMGRHDVLEVMERLRKHTTVFYSTHILNDVQRVSDTVAILNRGELVAMAPIEELLGGTEGAVYTLTTRGQPEGMESTLLDQAWVSSVRPVPNTVTTTWYVSVTDPEAAEELLLRRVLADGDVVVTNFGRKKDELEDVFMRLVEGNA